MKIPAPTLDAFRHRFPRGVPARLLRVIRGAVNAQSVKNTESQSTARGERVIRFCVDHEVLQDQEMFLRRLAESGFKIPWSSVIVSSELPAGNVLPAILFGGEQNRVVEPGVLQTYSINDLMHDVKKKKIFWESAKVVFREVISS